VSTPAALTTPGARPLRDERAEARFAEYLSASGTGT
jgi:hypothetical protein